MNNRTDPILYIVIPCYNEQEVLPITAPMFLQKLADLTAAGKISPELLDLLGQAYRDAARQSGPTPSR